MNTKKDPKRLDAAALKLPSVIGHSERDRVLASPQPMDEAAARQLAEMILDPVIRNKVLSLTLDEQIKMLHRLEDYGRQLRIYLCHASENRLLTLFPPPFHQEN